MNSFSIEKEKIKVDFSQSYIPPHVKNFMPDIYKEGRVYFCILGGGSENATISEGRSALEAMENWEEAYKKQRHHQ